MLTLLAGMGEATATDMQLQHLYSAPSETARRKATQIEIIQIEQEETMTAHEAKLAQAVQEAAEPEEAEEIEPEETEAIDPIEAFKLEILRLVNIERANYDAAPLELMEQLNVMANVRAEESSERFSHTRPDGTRCFTIFSEYNMRYKTAGENLAYGFRTPEAIVAAWMDSPSHRANLLDTDYEYIGIGYFDNGRRIYCSQLFYTPRA